jgi:phenylalanyl-tRNA synthetase beta chain
MLVSLDWINDFVKTPSDLSSKDLGIKLTLATAEVEEVNEVGLFWQQIRVAEITSIEPHPQADKLNIVSFKLGDNESFKVVCGASNVKVGLKTPFAPIGTTLPVGFTLEPKKIRGILSEGMLCSEEELALSESSSGIMELPADTPIGISLKDLWKKTSDIIFDIDNKSLTHRPDLWGHYGFAREFATIFDQPLKDSFSAEWMEHLKKSIDNSAEAPIKVHVDKDSACLAYFGLSIDGVSVGASPVWMKERLENAGLRSINNIVDISNYVMLELGHPLHIFDRDLIHGNQVTIKNLNEQQAFITLDEVERDLIVGDCVISDEEKPLVLAGIMGGLSSSVSETTGNVFIEVANWDAAQVRRTSTRLGLRSDSSARFEKTLDSTMCERVLIRAFELICELCPEAKVRGPIVYSGNSLDDISPVIIKMSADKIRTTLGKDVETERIQHILTSLGFSIQADGENLSITVPSFRATKDIDGPSDIIEEIGRIVGFDNIDPVGPLLNVFPVRLSTEQIFKRRAQDFLSMHGHALEVTTYPLIGDKLLKKIGWKEISTSPLRLLNALSSDQALMRDSLIPSFVETAALNSKVFDQNRFFEFGRS